MANSAVVGILRALLTADTAEFERAMKEASTTVASLGQALAKDLEPRQRAVNALVKDFVGADDIRRAKEYEQALAAIGDLSKLSADDQARLNKALSAGVDAYARMGEKAPESWIAIQQATTKAVAPTEDYGKQLSFVQQAQEKLATETTGMVGRIRDMALGYISGQLAIDAFRKAGELAVEFLKDSITEALEAEKIQKQLTAALTAQGAAIPEVIEFYDQLSKKYQDTTVYSDELIKEQEALLVQVGGVLPSQMDKALNAVTNLASGMQIDLRSATMLVAKAFEDNFASLKRAGVIIDETRAKTEGMDYVLGRIQARFGGDAQAEVESYAGQIAQLGNAWRDFQETVGTSLMQSGALEAGFIAVRVAIVLLNDEFRKLIAGFMAFQNLDLSNPLTVGAKYLANYLTALKKLNDEQLNARHASSVNVAAIESVSQALDAREHAEQDQAKRRKDQQKADEDAKRASDQYASSVQALANAWNGANLAKDAKKLADAYALLTPAQRANADVMLRVAEDARKASDAGAPLNAQLLRLANLAAEAAARQQLLRITLSGLTQEMLKQRPAMAQVNAAWHEAQYASADALAALLQGTTQANEALSAEEARVIALNDALAATHEANVQAWNAERMEAWSGQLGIVKSLVDDLGRNMSGSGRVITSVLSQAITLTQNYITSAHEAVDVTKLLSSFTTLGITVGIDYLAGVIAKQKQVKETVADLRHEIEALGGTPLPQPKLGADKYIKDLTDQLLGLKQAQQESVESALRLFDVIRKGGTDAAAAKEQIGGLLEHFAAQAEQAGGLWSSSFQSMIAQAKELGVGIEQVTSLIDGQLSKGASGLAKVVGGEFDAAIKKFDEFQQKVDAAKGGDPNDPNAQANANAAMRDLATFSGQTADALSDDFARTSRIALATFNAYIANGHTAAEAIAMVGPSIDILKEATERFGFEGNAAFDALSRWRDLTTANQPLLDQVSGLNDLMLALGNVGALDTQTFADLQAQGLDAFTQLTEAGFTQIEAEQQIAPLLQTIIDLHEQRGLAIDDETQKLIDQAREDGALKDQQISTNDILMQGLSAIITAVGGTLPQAWQDAADKARNKAKEIEKTSKDLAQGIHDNLGNLRFDVPVTFHTTTQNDGGATPPDGGIAGEPPPDWEPPPLPVDVSAVQAVSPSMLSNLSALSPRRSSAPSGPVESGGAMTLVFEDAGRVFARVAVPYIPGETRRLGLTTR